MISKFDLAKALHDKAKLISDVNNLKLVTNGEQYSGGVNEIFIQEFLLFGNDVSIGIADNSSDISVGIYQLNINTPKVKTKWSGLKFTDIFTNGFSKGLELTFNNQKVRIRTTSLETMMENETHFIQILSIRFSVIN